MCFIGRLCLAACFSIVSIAAAASSDWLSAPQPWFQPSAVRKSVKGVVKVHLMIANDGHVTSSTIIKSSGDFLIDLAAKDVVLRWKLKPSAIKPSDIAKGRVVEFLYGQ